MTTRQTVTLTAAAAAAAGATGLIVRRLRDSGGADSSANGSLHSESSNGRGEPEVRNRWRSVTIFLPADQVMPAGRPPEPLAELGDLIEVKVRAAPGDRGTELGARLREPEPAGLSAVVGSVKGDDPTQRVRAALRASKQLLETGEILRVDPRPHGERSGGIGSKVLEFASRRAGGEGLL